MRIKTSDLPVEDQRLIRRHLMSLKAINRAPKTIEDREAVIRRLAWWLRETVQTDLTGATHEHLATWQHSISHLSPESRRSYTCHVRSFYGWRSHGGEDNVAEFLIIPSIPKTQPRPMDEGSVDLSLIAIREPEKTWIALANFVGLRAGEIARIEREDIRRDVSPKLLHVHGKGSRERLVVLDEEMDAMLANHIDGPGPLWRAPSGRLLRGKDISGKCSAALHALGIPFTLHNGRHRAGTVLFRATKNIRVVQEVLGHASLSTTARYTAVASTEMEAGMRKLAKKLHRRKEVTTCGAHDRAGVSPVN
jgi:integrase/recombinase XerC